jgi:hypothetical protein
MICSECSENAVYASDLGLGGKWYWCEKHLLRKIAFTLWYASDNTLEEIEDTSDKEIVKIGSRLLMRLILDHLKVD